MIHFKINLGYFEALSNRFLTKKAQNTLGEYSKTYLFKQAFLIFNFLMIFNLWM